MPVQEIPFFPADKRVCTQSADKCINTAAADEDVVTAVTDKGISKIRSGKVLNTLKQVLTGAKGVLDLKDRQVDAQVGNSSFI